MRRQTLLTQVLLVNLLLIAAAVVAASVASTPNSELQDTDAAGLVLGFALSATVAVNVFLLSRRFRPLQQLADEMERVNLARPTPPPADGPIRGPEEVERLEQSFRRMLERLEAERRRAASAALEAQERERTRVARDLHDEVNQALTGLVLRIEAMRLKAPSELAGDLADVAAVASQAMEELLTLARQLRPTALDDLGLEAALADLVEEIDAQSEISASFETAGGLGVLADELQLVIYRVAQEALSNAVQHAGAANVRVRLAAEPRWVELRVSDDGRGFADESPANGLGIAGMRERALLVGGELRIESRPNLGTRVTLRVPDADTGTDD